jgi:ribosomal protein S18 acetylase RimI-like enzyme
MGVRVRLAAESDADAIVEFGSAVIPAHYTPILGAAVARRQLTWWDLGRIESAIAAGRIVVAVVGDDIVGVAETGELAGEQVIWKLYLAPDFRGRSLGVELLRRAIEALPSGTDHVLVEHVAGNARAGRFYEREGFAVVKTKPARSGNPDGAIVWRQLEL